MHVERPAQVDRDQLLPLLGLGIGEVLEPVPAGVVHEDVDGRFFQCRPGRLVVGNVEHQGLAVNFCGDFPASSFIFIGNQNRGFFLRKARANRAADGAAAAGDEHRFAGKTLHLGLLSMTRFALPIERSMLPILTSTVMPM